jgi:hypothetical protein
VILAGKSWNEFHRKYREDASSDPVLVCVGLVVYKLALCHVLLQILQFSLSQYYSTGSP